MEIHEAEKECKDKVNDKIIFLDIDGVLNLPKKSTGWDSSVRLNTDCCIALKEILDSTGAFIVVTSTWRRHECHMNILKEQLKEYGIFAYRIVGQTADLRVQSSIYYTDMEIRWLEIKEYIDKKRVKEYVIIDDLDLKKYDKEHLIRTELSKGLTAELAAACIIKLKVK